VNGAIQDGSDAVITPATARSFHRFPPVLLVVIKELLGHAHIGVTATVYAHVRIRFQHDAIDTLSTALGSPATTETAKRRRR
jgi:hypothetical protein